MKPGQAFVAQPVSRRVRNAHREVLQRPPDGQEDARDFDARETLNHLWARKDKGKTPDPEPSDLQKMLESIVSIEMKSVWDRLGEVERASANELTKLPPTMLCSEG